MSWGLPGKGLKILELGVQGGQAYYLDFPDGCQLLLSSDFVSSKYKLLRMYMDCAWVKKATPFKDIKITLVAVLFIMDGVVVSAAQK